MYRGLLSILLLIAAAATPILWYFSQTHSLLWQISWYAVFLLMLFRPLSDLFPSQKFLRRLIPLRKELGILSAAIPVTNFLYTLLQGKLAITEWSYWDPTTPNAWGNYATLAGIILLLTSNRFSQRKLKRWWKRIQKLSYLYFYGAAILLISYNQLYVKITAPIVLTVGTIAMVHNFLKKRAQKE